MRAFDRPRRQPRALGANSTALATFALLVSLSIPSAAEVPQLKLSWEAPAGCPTQSEVERQVEKLLVGRAPAAADLEARVVVTEEASGAFHASLATGSAGIAGTRTLQGESCSAIALATSMVLALTLVPDASIADPKPKPIPKKPPPTPSAAPRVREAEKVGGPQTRVELFVQAFGGVAVRALPQPAALVGLGVGVRRQAWDLEIGFRLAAKQELRLGYPENGTAELSYWLLPAHACVAPLQTRSVELAACAGLAFERWSGRAARISAPGNGAGSLISGQGGIRSQLWIARKVSISLSVEASVRPVHPWFVVGGLGRVYEIPLLSGALLGGLAFRF